MFTFSQQREGADSILGQPDESEDDVFGSHGSNKAPIPTIPELPPAPVPAPVPETVKPLPQPVPVYTQPTPVPVLIAPPTPVPVPASDAANPFSFGFDSPPDPAPAVAQPRPVAPKPVPVPVASQPWPAAAAPLPVPVPVPAPTHAASRSAPSVPTVEELPEEEPQPKRPSRSRTRAAEAPSTGIPKAVFFGVVGYAFLMTVLAVYGLFIKSGEKLDPGHPLSTIPDNFGEFDPVSRKKVSLNNQIKLDGPLPASQVATLGGKIEIGQLAIEPVKVEIRPLTVVSESQAEKQSERRAKALVMHLKITNSSPDLPIFPMDPAFTRKARIDDREPATRLVLGNKTFFGGAIEWPLISTKVKRKYEQEQEKDAIALKPGESRDYVVFTDSDPQIVKAASESNDTILWRVQVRRGLVEFKGKDVPASAIIGVEFKASDIN